MRVSEPSSLLAALQEKLLLQRSRRFGRGLVVGLCAVLLVLLQLSVVGAVPLPELGGAKAAPTIRVYPDGIACQNSTAGKLVGKTKRFQTLKKIFPRPTSAQKKRIQSASERCRALQRPELLYVDAQLRRDCAGKKYDSNTRNCQARKGGMRGFNRLRQALLWAGPGDEVVVRAGTYREAVTVSVGGTVEKPLIVRANVGEAVVIDGQKLRATGITVRADQVRLTGFSLVGHAAGASGAVAVQNGTGVELGKMQFRANSLAVSLTGAATEVVIEQSIFLGNRDGIRVSDAARVTARTSIFGATTGVAFQFMGAMEQERALVHHSILSSSGSVSGVAAPLSVVRSLFVDCVGAPLGMISGERLRGNLFVNCSAPNGLHVSNQAFLNAAAAGLSAAGTPTEALNAASSASSGVVAEVYGQIVAAFAAVYRAGLGSPLQDAGDDLGLNLPDITGVMPVGRVDVGPFENGTGGLPPTSTPTQTSSPTPTMTSTPTPTPTATPTPTPTATPTPILGGLLVPTPQGASPHEFHTETAFLYSGANPVQLEVTPGALAPRLVAVMRGRVFDEAGAPLDGVRVSVRGHAELGYTMSRGTGDYDLAVNGGDSVTLEYRREGYVASQRREVVPRRAFVELDPVHLTRLDPDVSVVTLSTLTTNAVVQGSISNDSSGERRGTLLVKPGTTAQLVLPNGTLQPVNTLSLRVTEFTVGPNGLQRMPGALPPTSGYTYAAELSADEAIAVGASEIRFSQSLPYYVNNFLSFPVGMSVPVGYYDRVASVWKPSNDGRVIKILSVAGGVASVDIAGSGVAATSSQLATIGITPAELTSLGGLFPAGTELWRVQLDHFTPWDLNWPFGPPVGATAPQNPPVIFDTKALSGCTNTQRGSIIGCEDQSLGETLPILGTEYALNYSTLRTPGYKQNRRFTIVVSGATLPPNVQAMLVTVTVAGKLFQYEFPPSLNKQIEFEWDGKNVYEQPVWGAVTASVRVGYKYEGNYFQPGAQPQSFGLTSGIPVTNNFTRREVILWQTSSATLEYHDLRRIGLGGWSLTPLHFYDSASQQVFRGDGSVQRADGTEQIIETIAGNGVAGFSGDGGPATAASLNEPYNAVLGPDGNIYIADTLNHRIRRVDQNGIITTFAGNGQGGSCFTGQGGPAAAAPLSVPRDIAFGPDGSMYIAEDGHRCLHRIDPAGNIYHFYSNFFGSGNLPMSVDVDSSGGVIVPRVYFFFNGVDSVVHHINTNGIPSVLAGVGGWGGPPVGDNGPAAQAFLSSVRDATVGPNGEVYLTEYMGNRVRVVNPNGIIQAFAGNGQPGSTGDGGSALVARLSTPMGTAISPSGDVYISEFGGARIRRVSRDGIITTFAGSGVGGFAGDGGPATNARFNGPRYLSYGADRALYVGDSYNHRIRRIRHPYPSFNTQNIVVPSADGAELYEFSPNGQHLRTRSTLTGVVLYQFAYTDGRVSSITDRDGGVTLFSYNGIGQLQSITAPQGKVTSVTMNNDGYLSTLENEEQEVFTMSYGEQGLLSAFTTPLGAQSTFTYNEAGLLLTDTDARGAVQTLTRSTVADGYAVRHDSPLNRQTLHTVEQLATGMRRRTVQEPDGAAVVATQDTLGTVSTTYPDGTVSTTTVGPDRRFQMVSPRLLSEVVTVPSVGTKTTTFGRNVVLAVPNDPLSLTSMTDSMTVNSRTWTTSYDAVNDLVTIMSPLGRVVTEGRDDRLRTTSYSIPGLSPIEYSYNGQGFLTSMAQGTGPTRRETIYTHTPRGEVATVTNPLGQVTTYTYDGAGRVTSELLFGGAQIDYSYDAAGNLVALGPPGRPTHVFTYSMMSDPASYTPPTVSGGGQPTTFEYNTDRALQRIVRADGGAITFGYGATSGKLAGVTGPTTSASFAYDTAGRMQQQILTGGATVQFGYAGSLVTSQTWSGPISGSVQFGYDSTFRLTAVGVNGGSNISYGYDNDDLLVTAGALTLVNDSQTGLLTSVSSGSGANQIVESNTYSNFGELATRTVVRGGSQTIFGVTFTRNGLGQITDRVESDAAGSHSHHFDYDDRGRLVQSQRDGLTAGTYTYDANGNRLSVNGIAATFDDQDRLLTQGSLSFTYSANGEQLSKSSSNGTTQYTYNDFGALTRAVVSPSVDVSYVLDAKMRRVGKRLNGTLVQGFLYQTELAPVAELNGTGAVVSRFVYGSRTTVPDYMVKAGVTYRIISDSLGSPRFVVNAATGAIAQELRYDDWGVIVFDSSPGFQPFGFAGGLYDPATKLTHFGAREYDAEIGRWTTKDPLGFGGGDANLYGYVFGDPINLIDPSGLLWFVPGALAGAEIAGATMTASRVAIFAFVQSILIFEGYVGVYNSYADLAAELQAPLPLPPITACTVDNPYGRPRRRPEYLMPAGPENDFGGEPLPDPLRYQHRFHGPNPYLEQRGRSPFAGGPGTNRALRQTNIRYR